MSSPFPCALPEAWTVAIGFRVAELREYVLLHKGDGRTYGNSSLFIGRYAAGAGDPRLAVWLSTGADWLRVFTDAVCEDGEWHRIVTTFEPGQLKVWLDGKPIATTTVTACVPATAGCSWEWGFHASLGTVGPPDELAEIVVVPEVWGDPGVDYAAFRGRYPSAVRHASVRRFAPTVAAPRRGAGHGHALGL